MMVSTTSVHNQKQKNSHSQREEQQPCQSLHHHHYTSLLSFLLFLLFLASCTAGAHAQRRGPRTYPLLAAIPESAFRCGGRSAGYYADIETGCQVYHMCDTLEKQFSYLCPNHTLFNQKFMVCDHWYMVNCTMADSFYDLNDHIGEVPDKGANTIDGGNNQSVRKSTIFTQKPQGVHQFKAIVPVTLKKIQSTTKTTQVPSSRPTLLPANSPGASQTSFFTVPNNPFAIKSTSKPTNRPQTSLFTTRRPLNPFSNSAFTRPPFSVPSLSFTSATTSKPARASVFNRNIWTSATTSKPARESVFSRNTLISSTTPKPARASVFNHNTLTSSTTSKPARASVFNHNTLTSSITPKPSRTFVFNRNTLTSAPTPKPARASVFNHNTLTSTTSQNSAGLSVFNRNTFTTTTRPITVTTKKPFTSRFPGNVARSPGGSFSFAQMKLHNLTISRQQLDGLVFRPLVANPFSIKNRSSIPSFAFSSTSKPLNSNLKRHPLVTTPHNLDSLESDEEEDQTSQHSTQQVLAAPLRALGAPLQPFGIPVPSRLLVPPPFNIFTNSIPVPITNVIEPPTARRKGTSPIKLSESFITNPQVVRTNPGQETPLTPFTKKPPKFRPFGTSEEVFPGVLHISFQSARGNRDFFIPSSGLSLPEETLPAPPNSLSTTDDDNDHDHEDNVPHTDHGTTLNTHDFHMTMLFPGSSGTSVISALALNPQCPHCHPAFLQPGQCTPCVRIRR